MATKKDLVESYSFSRRRLVTAFVSGAPGGREVEPTKPGRTIIGGIALAVLLVVGAVVVGIIKKPTTVDWAEGTLVSEKETGADYVVLAKSDGGEDDVELRPIANITSAMLLLGADIEPTVVKHEEIAEQDRGEAIGILGAPATPPAASALLPSGWTACTRDDAGLRVAVSGSPAVDAAPAVGFVVQAAGDDTQYLIAEASLPGLPQRAYSFELTSNVEKLKNAVFASSAPEVVEVPREFIELFPVGGPLSTGAFGLSRAEARKAAVVAVGSDTYLQTPDGEIKLTDFAEAVWGVLGSGKTTKKREQDPIRADELAKLGVSRWPEVPVQRTVALDICAQLETEPGLAPAVRLATTSSTSDNAVSRESSGGIERDVAAGAGAFVTAGDWDAKGTGSLLLIDDRAYAYRVAGPTEQANLGYGSVTPVVVPDAWTGLFVAGVTLSIDAASCPPTTQRGGKTCADGG